MQHVHFIGIGGVGMSGLAQVMLARGARVSGSDPAENAATQRLEAQGATLYREQAAENIERERPDLVVVTAAIPEDNPELAAARAAGIETVSRADFLGRLMAEFRGPRIAVTGTHGKTTTTAMLASVLIAGGLDPTVLIGGEFPAIGGNVRVGSGEVFLTEACEAYDSFLSLRPDIAVITNIDADHLDYYQTEQRVHESFRRFVEQTSREGLLVSCAEDTGVFRVLREMPVRIGPRRSLDYGLSPSSHRVESIWAADVELSGTGSSFVARRRIGEQSEERLGPLCLRVPGTHNILNALAALAVGLELNIPFEKVREGLEAFTGTERRFEVLGEGRGIVVVDDYAHHPTEIRATFAAARAAYPDRRIVAAFQPHLYSRTRDFLDEFASALAEADAILLTDIYPAREKPIPGVSVINLTRRIADLAPDSTLLYLPDKKDVVGALKWVTQPGDLVLVMGAGDIRKVGETFAAVLKRDA